jgi:molecular chaperone GrpE
MSKKSPKIDGAAKQVEQEITNLRTQLVAAQEREKRVLADYQNLVRRNQEERLKFIQMANLDLVLALLQPLEHLELAVGQLSNKGLTLAFGELKRALKEFGVEEIVVLNQPFDVETMEAVEGSQGKVVKQVVRVGWRLNGAVIQHAKVILA